MSKENKAFWTKLSLVGLLLVGLAVAWVRADPPPVKQQVLGGVVVTQTRNEKKQIVELPELVMVLRSDGLLGWDLSDAFKAALKKQKEKPEEEVLFPKTEKNYR